MTMTIRIQNMFKGRFCPLYLFFMIFLSISSLTRTVLLVKSLPMLNVSIWLLFRIYGVGFFYDVVTQKLKIS
jgi:hypothetical protein